MKLKEDKKLKQLMEDIAYHCKDKNYQLILAVKTDDENDGQSISASGDVLDIVVNLVMFAENVGKHSGYNVLELVKKCCESALETNANNS